MKTIRQTYRGHFVDALDRLCDGTETTTSLTVASQILVIAQAPPNVYNISAFGEFGHDVDGIPAMQTMGRSDMLMAMHEVTDDRGEGSSTGSRRLQ